MGGSAFTSGPDALYTPRMPPAVYRAVRDSCRDILHALFIVAASPVEGPGKTDFGDVDILVALPRVPDEDGGLARLLDEASARLGAVRSITVAHEGKASMAIPWPASFADCVPDARTTGASPGALPPAYIQVDLAISPSLARFHWALFHHAHGDLWNILGSAGLRPLGLTVDERALWLRVPEIERAHRNRAKVFLTDEPAEVLHFLGLRILDDSTRSGSPPACASRWEKPFPTAQALFEYATTCPFVALPEEADLDMALKANDRRRLQVRPLFRQWAAEFVPRWRAAAAAAAAAATHSIRPCQATATPRPTRASVRDAAFAYFPGTQGRFEAARGAWLRERHLLAIRAAAKAAVPADLPSMYRGTVCAAVRRRLGLVMGGPKPAAAADGSGCEQDGSSTAAAAAAAAAEVAAALWTVDSVTAHVEQNWMHIAAEAAPVEHARFLASRGGSSQGTPGSAHP